MSNTSISREVPDEEEVEKMLKDIKQAARKKEELIERMKAVKAMDEEILRVSLNLGI